MSVTPQRSGGSINHWARLWGISLRPWSGRSPSWLIIRGLIQVAVYGFILIQVMRVSRGEYEAVPGELESLTGLIVMLVVVFGIGLMVAGAMLVVGLLDLFPRRRVVGRVLSVRERKTADFLPEFIQDAIFARNANGLDRRRPRVEVELATNDGVRQWTVRSARIRRELTQGSRVTLTVSPIVGHVARVETQPD